MLLPDRFIDDIATRVNHSREVSVKVERWVVSQAGIVVHVWALEENIRLASSYHHNNVD